MRTIMYICKSKLILFHDNIKTLNDVTCLVDDDVSEKHIYLPSCICIDKYDDTTMYKVCM